MRSQHRTRTQIEPVVTELRDEVGRGAHLAAAVRFLFDLETELELAAGGAAELASNGNERLANLYRSRDLVEAARLTVGAARDLAILALVVEAEEADREITRDEVAVYEEKTGGGS